MNRPPALVDLRPTNQSSTDPTPPTKWPFRTATVRRSTAQDQGEGVRDPLHRPAEGLLVRRRPLFAEKAKDLLLVAPADGQFHCLGSGRREPNAPAAALCENVGQAGAARIGVIRSAPRGSARRKSRG